MCTCRGARAKGRGRSSPRVLEVMGLLPWQSSVLGLPGLGVLGVLEQRAKPIEGLGKLQGVQL